MQLPRSCPLVQVPRIFSEASVLTYHAQTLTSFSSPSITLLPPFFQRQQFLTVRWAHTYRSPTDVVRAALCEAPVSNAHIRKQTLKVSHHQPALGTVGSLQNALTNSSIPA